VTEPTERAGQVNRIAPYTMHWSVADDRIDGAQSDSYALHTKSGVIFVDPLPLTYAAADRFPSVAWALLTRACHQRAQGLLTEPDQHYTDGTRLPAGFQQIRTPGPEYDHFALFRPGEPSILFVGDLVRRRDASSLLELAPVQQGLAPDIALKSLAKLLELDFELLCLSHGGYIEDDPKGALQELLERTV